MIPKTKNKKSSTTTEKEGGWGGGGRRKKNNNAINSQSLIENHERSESAKERIIALYISTKAINNNRELNWTRDDPTPLNSATTVGDNIGGYRRGRGKREREGGGWGRWGRGGEPGEGLWVVVGWERGGRGDLSGKAR